jgi:hypothetical protein
MKMPYEVSFDEQDEIVLLRASGLVTHEEHTAARRQAAQLCRENKSSKILADLRKLDTEKSSTLNCFDYGESLAQENISLSTLIAIVLPTDLGSSEDIEFVATVAANRGRAPLLFKTIEEAKQWLLEK